MKKFTHSQKINLAYFVGMSAIAIIEAYCIGALMKRLSQIN